MKKIISIGLYMAVCALPLIGRESQVANNITLGLVWVIIFAELFCTVSFTAANDKIELEKIDLQAGDYLVVFIPVICLFAGGLFISSLALAVAPAVRYTVQSGYKLKEGQRVSNDRL